LFGIASHNDSAGASPDRFDDCAGARTLDTRSTIATVAAPSAGATDIYRAL